MLSRREAEVLDLLRQRLSNQEIASRLHISVRTAENHVASVLRKYGVNDRRSVAELLAETPAKVQRLPGLPQPRTSFVGRLHERDAVLGLLKQSPLISLVGPGGMGKTRLAISVAESAIAWFPVGGAFVDLVPVHAEFTEQAVAAALGVSQRSQQDLAEAIAERLGQSPALLVLDNCEHLLDPVAALADLLLAACPKLKILATSRERLGLSGERIVRIAPLSLASDAEKLFLDRALAADPGFTAGPGQIASLCSTLEGMPLAIELAAARSGSIGVSGLLAAMDDQLSLLSGGRGGAQRHRSLNAVIGWSHDLLDDKERLMFRRLAVFAGRFDLPAAAHVTQAAAAHVAQTESNTATAVLLGQLADKSLLVQQQDRWHMLATIRAFAEKQLRLSHEDQMTRQRHLSWAVAETRRLRMLAPAQRNKEFDEVADDLRAALASAVDDPGEAPHQLARALGHLAYSRRFLTEAHGHFVEAARRAPTAAEAAADLQTASHAVYAFGHAGQAFDLLIAAAQQARAAGAGVAQTIALSDAAITAARFPSGFTKEVAYEELLRLIEQAEAAGGLSDPAAAAHLAAARVWTAHRAKITPEPAQAETALAAARAIRDPFLISSNYDAMGTIALRAGRFAEAHAMATQRLDLLEDMDYHDPRAAPEILDIFLSATTCALAAGELPAAVVIGQRVFSDSLLGTHPYRATSRLVPALALSGDFDAALAHAERMLDGWERLGRPAAAWMSPGMSAVALIHGLTGQDAEYVRWQALATEAGGGAGSPAYSCNTASFASFVKMRVAIHNGQPADPAPTGDSPLRAYAIATDAELAVITGLSSAAKRLREAKRLTAQNKWARACLLRAQWRLTGTDRALRESLGVWTEIGARFEHAYTSKLASGAVG